MKGFVYTLAICFAMIALQCCNQSAKKTENVQDTTDLEYIQKKGEIVVLTLNSPTSYFEYRGEDMGYQYDLAKDFARSLHVNLKLKIAKNEDELVEKLLNGEGDLIAYNTTITNERKKSLSFSSEEHIAYQVVVQKRGKNAAKVVTDLIGKDVYAFPGKYFERLENLNKEVGGGMNLHLLSPDSLSMDEAMALVDKGKIPFLLSDKDYALVSQTYLPSLKTDLVITFGQRTAWAVRKNSPQLLKAIQEWESNKATKETMKTSLERYFRLNKEETIHKSYAIGKGRISPFDYFFKKYAPEINWEWTLLASLAYKESTFNPDAVSWAGAVGLMQLMPTTAHNLGVPVGMEKDPEQSIKAAVKYIGKLQRMFKEVTPQEEQNKFILASYNAGEGHILDAMALAEKYGKNKYLWAGNVAEYLLLKSQPEYYQDPVCKRGYFRGQGTYDFVVEILNRAELYRRAKIN